MVKKIAIFFGYVSFFILALIYFTPKISLYYFAEQELKVFDVVVSSEALVDTGFSLKIQNPTVNIKSIESAKIQELDIKILGLYNSVNISNIGLSSTAKSFLPLNIEYINITHTIVDPLHINAEAIGEFGEAKVVVNLLDRNLSIVLLPSKLMKDKYANTLRNLKKSENGEFVYAKTF